MISPRPPSSCRISRWSLRRRWCPCGSHDRRDRATRSDAGLPHASHCRYRTRQRHRTGLQARHEPVTVRRSTSSPPEAGHGAGGRGCAPEPSVRSSPRGPRPAGPATHPAQHPFPGQPWPPAVAPIAAAPALAAIALAAAAAAEFVAAEPAAAAAASRITTDANADVAAATRALGPPPTPHSPPQPHTVSRDQNDGPQRPLPGPMGAYIQSLAWNASF